MYVCLSTYIHLSIFHLSIYAYIYSGFYYVGPVDAHDMENLVPILGSDDMLLNPFIHMVRLSKTHLLPCLYLQEFIYLYFIHYLVYPLPHIIMILINKSKTHIFIYIICLKTMFYMVQISKNPCIIILM